VFIESSEREMLSWDPADKGELVLGGLISHAFYSSLPNGGPFLNLKTEKNVASK
jgi:hypothetical protein